MSFILQDGRHDGRRCRPDDRFYLWVIQHPPVSSQPTCDPRFTHRKRHRNGAGPRGFLATLSQYMLSSAATFSFFLAIGSVRVYSKSFIGHAVTDSIVAQVIRNDGLLPPHMEAARLQLLPPLVRSKAEGAIQIRARWDAERARKTTA